MKTITIAGTSYNYDNDKELKEIIKKYPNIKIGKYFDVGDYFQTDENLKVGDIFKAGDDFYVLPESHLEIPNGYQYIARCYYEQNSQQWYIQLGCQLRTLDEWESDFWNNPDGFPNDNSEKSLRRLQTYNNLKKWIYEFKLNRKEK